MSAVTPLVDTLLATRLGQRVDLVPLRAQLEIPGPGAVENVEKVENDVRLPSREALQRQLGPGLVGQGGAVPDFTQGRAGGAVTLSAAARTVSALLQLPVGTTPAVRGLVPLLPDMRAPAVPALAAALSRTVAESGLFYESHLQQFAAGQRMLTQLAREPQAGLASPAGETPALEGGLRLPAAGPAIPPLAALVLPTGDVAAVPGMPLDRESAPAADLPDTPDVVSKLAASQLAGPAPAPANLLAPPGGAARSPDPAGPATSYGPTGLPDHAVPSLHDFSLQDAGAPASEAAPAGAARGGHAAPAAIHPEAVGLVRQQLEMLAVPVFRWSGEGWPGVPMDWEIRQERQEQQKYEEQAGREGRQGGDTEPASSAWTTRMTLKLPRLGTVDVRLGLAGRTLQLRLNASQAGTAAVLDQARAGLPQRFGAVGLELTDLQISGAQRMPGAAQSTGESHAG